MGYEAKNVILVSYTYTGTHKKTQYIHTKTRRHGKQGHTNIILRDRQRHDT